MLVEKKGGRCERCNGYFLADVFDFHHRDPSEKLFTLKISNLTDKPWSAVLKEVEKCEMLCANCHRKVHWEERHDRPRVRYRGGQPSPEPHQMSLFSDQGDDE